MFPLKQKFSFWRLSFNQGMIHNILWLSGVSATVQFHSWYVEDNHSSSHESLEETFCYDSLNNHNDPAALNNPGAMLICSAAKSSL
jgi:hypothetical protein